MAKRYRINSEKRYISRADLHGMLSYNFSVRGYKLVFETGIASIHRVYLKKDIDKTTQDVIEMDVHEFEEIVNPDNWNISYDWDMGHRVTDPIKGIWLTKTETK